MRRAVIRPMALCALLVCISHSGFAAEPGPRERVLFSGFEKDKLLTWTKAHRDMGDTLFVYLPGDRGRVAYTVRKGTATEGEWALSVSIGADKAPALERTRGYETLAASYMDWEPRYAVSPSLKPGRLANLLPGLEFTRAVESSEGRRLESAAHHGQVLLYTRYDEAGVVYPPEAFPRDWTGYDLLRVDAFPEKGEVKLRVAVEDDKIVPPLEKRFAVPAGKWSTLELDLGQAAKERALNLAKMVNFWTLWEEASAPTRVYVDNVRLAPRGVAAKLPVVAGTDKAPRPIAEMSPASKVEPDGSRIAAEKPIVLNLPTVWDRAPEHLCLWAYDNSRLVLDNGCPYQTLDGGKTWRTFTSDGAVTDWRHARVALPGGSTSDPQAASAMDAAGSILFFGNYGACLYHCAPPVDSLYFRKLVIRDSGWEISPLYIVGGETRGCSQGRRLVVLPTGRIWCAHRVHERQPPSPRIHAAYSDDGGRTWRGAGVAGKLTGTLADTLVGGTSSAESSGTRQRFHDPLSLVPYGEHVAVTWAEYRAGWHWSRFDGTAWSTPASIPSKLIDERTLRYSTVTLGGNRLFLSTDKGIIAWDGSQWSDEPSSPARALLTVSGDKLFGVTWEGGKLLLWKRSDGQWRSEELASEATQVALVALPPASPPNSIPVAWNHQGQKTVKLLRVPLP